MALSVSSSLAVGPGLGVSAISPVNLDTEVGNLTHFGARLLGRESQPHRSGWDDARSVDDALFDMVPQRQVSLSRTASGQDGRISGFQKLLHLRLLVGSGIDMPVGIDIPGHGGHAFGVDDLQPLCIRGARARGNNLAGAYNHGARSNHSAVADDHSGVGDRHILRGEADTAQAQKAGQRVKGA